MRPQACRILRRATLMASFVLMPALGHAAGGHHAVDDADIVEPGRCELEAWHERSFGSGRLLHTEVQCRVGPLELAGSAEPQREAVQSTTVYGLEAKWAAEVAPKFSVGWKLRPEWQAHARPRFQGTSAAALVTWSVVENVRLHANLGRDFVNGGADEPRSGVAFDWSPGGGAWQLAAERYRKEGGHFARAGVRWTPAKDWTLDLSRAVHLRGEGESSWTVGLKREFGR